MTDNMSGKKMDREYSIFEEQISLEPDHYKFCDEYIIKIQDSFWTHRLYTFQRDVQDFKTKLTPQEQELIIRNLALIGQLEISVKKFWAKIGDNLPHPSIYDLGFTMASNEVVHGKAYKNLLKVLGIDDVFSEILELDIIKSRVNYLTKHLHKFHSNNKKQFVYSLILFTLYIENLALFAPFYTIGWFNIHRDDVLPDTYKQVQYTSREETIHSDIGITFINEIKKEHPELFDDELREKVLKESLAAIDFECEIILWSLNDYVGDKLSPEILKEFLKDRLNTSLSKIGYGKIFDIDKDILTESDWFYEEILAQKKSDFFHERATEYGFGGQSFDESELF